MDIFRYFFGIWFVRTDVFGHAHDKIRTAAVQMLDEMRTGEVRYGKWSTLPHSFTKNPISSLRKT
ncbi:uncharacterized protein LOC144138910 isoform X4 [Haemaphysalis longicornis]